VRISLSAKQLVMPPVCACCGGASTASVPVSATRVRGKRVIRTTTSTWEFPFCGRCCEHDRAWPKASGLEVLVLTILTLGIYLYFYVKGRQRAMALRAPSCAMPCRAVAYLGWHGTVHELEVASEEFARAFLAANGKKLVDADAEARELMARAAAEAVAAKRGASRSAAAARGASRSAPETVPAARGAPPPAASSASSAPSAPAQRAPAASSASFHGPQQSVTVAGRRLEGPLAYVASDAAQADASAIVPSLRVGSAAGAEPLPRWPTYAEASPAQRAVYLDWHAAGRADPDVPIGYVFLHFYGLERRVLIDSRDQEIIQGELRRLLSIYGPANRSFRSYATSLLAFTMLPGLASLPEYAVDAHLAPIAGDSESAMAGLLAWLHLHERPLPASAAMLVAGSMEGARGGAVLERARAELESLFTLRYRERFGDGLRLEAAKRPQVIAYHPASPTLLSAARRLRVSIPHVLGRPAQLSPLVELWNECVADLKQLSAARREDADAPLTREAWLALPPELRARYEHPDQDAWDDAVRAAERAGGVHVVSAGRLAALAGLEVGERVTAARLRKAVEAAAALGYAVEPDARVAAKAMPAGAELAIWRSRATEAPDRAIWRSVHAMLLLTLSVALADGHVADEEGRTVDGLIDDLFALDDSMRARVGALRTILARQPARATTVARKLKASRSPGELGKIARVLVAVAAVDGVIVEGEHKALKALYKAMGLPPAELAAAIAGSGARLAGDAAAAPAQAAATAGAGAEAQATTLDGAAIAAILAETREVAMMLAEVLDDEDDAEDPAGSPPPRAQQQPAPGTGAWPSLDARYHAALRELLTRQVWTAAEVRALAAREKLMPGAILEAVNAWSEEQFGDHVIEEAGDWRVHAGLLERPTA
jgi:uncharacterized tellurite resistance protein B-like protein